MEREAGVLQERQRLAREIHDTIAQDLTGIVAQLEAAAQARARGADDTGYLDAAMTLAREGLNEARRSVRAIGPGELEGARLPDALAKVAGGWSERNGVPGRLRHHRDAADRAPRGRGDAAARRPGGAGQRRPPRRAPPASASR